MESIILFKWTNLQAVDAWDTKNGFALEYCGNYGFVECDNGNDFELPTGYTLAESTGGEIMIYDENNKCCDIEYSKGNPVLSSTTRKIIIKGAAA
ncbi:hypothetical protein [Paenibacillus sp. L3-i20]|uniref:hypothetical protein n=1 Tax=Paenibacillus sp. L3-i20 TaxID=2905833 RepID=UPI001EE03B55|nr:hypothetical protein [Paenibacillus sp. L3-i20]GKU76855.1 hypothetical protein L3i20_v212520 [Paenibacillus sp. L3-i20]